MNDWKQWAENWKAANELERKLKVRKPRLTAEEYLDQALDLMAFAEELSGVDPFTCPDPIRERENGKVQDSWMKLHVAWGRDR